jgi:hypothetical protein
MHPGGTRDQGARAARALSAVTFGDGRPLVPDDTHRQGPAAMVAAALRKLAALRRERGRVVYHRRPGDESIDTGDC